MGEGKLFRPSERGKRSPTSNAKENGQIVNPPRYAEIGGATGPAKQFSKNKMRVVAPGGTK